MKLNFKNRIALFTAVAAAAIIGLVFCFVYGVVFLTAYSHLDSDIRQESKEVLSNLQWTKDSIQINSMPEWEEKEHNQIEVNPTFIQLVDRKGRLLYRTSNLQRGILLYYPKQTVPIFFDSYINGRRIRQGQFPLLNKMGDVVGHLMVGISSAESAIVLHNLGATLWIAFPSLLIILFVATSLAASKGIAPVKHLIRAASGIGESNISSRLPLPGNEDEIHQLAITINELLERVESGMQREKQFTADASHEIRTPLTAIRGTLEVLIRKKREPSQYEEKINRVIAEVDRLNGMLEQLLQLSRLESGRIPVYKISADLHHLCHQTREKWRGPLHEKNMKFHAQVPKASLIDTDVEMLGILLDNLVGNAVKYGHPGGAIDFVWYAETRTLLISDNGPGIPAEHLPNLFDRFYRADNSRSSAIKGAGLGLSIAKKMADLLHIQLFVKSNEGEGTAFTLRFPA